MHLPAGPRVVSSPCSTLPLLRSPCHPRAAAASQVNLVDLRAVLAGLLHGPLQGRLDKMQAALISYPDMASEVRCRHAANGGLPQCSASM